MTKEKHINPGCDVTVSPKELIIDDSFRSLPVKKTQSKQPEQYIIDADDLHEIFDYFKWQKNPFDAKRFGAIISRTSEKPYNSTPADQRIADAIKEMERRIIRLGNYPDLEQAMRTYKSAIAILEGKE